MAGGVMIPELITILLDLQKLCCERRFLLIAVSALHVMRDFHLSTRISALL